MNDKEKFEKLGIMFISSGVIFISLSTCMLIKIKKML